MTWTGVVIGFGELEPKRSDRGVIIISAKSPARPGLPDSTRMHSLPPKTSRAWHSDLSTQRQPGQ